MGNTGKFFVSMFFFCILFMGWVGQGFTAESPELVRMRESFTMENNKILVEPRRQAHVDKYIEDLVSLEFNLRSSRRPRAEVNAVRHELRRIKKERYAAPVVKADFAAAAKPKPSPPAVKVAAVRKTITPKPAMVKPVTQPVVKPVASPISAPVAPQSIVASLPVVKPVAPAPKAKHIPKTQASDVKGLAGSPKFSKNNIYSFNLAETGAVSTLVYWATGRRSTDTFGKIWLLNPENNRLLVGKWKKNYFKITARGVTDYKNLTPLTVDISEAVTGSGPYKVEFEWGDGVDPLVIFRVEITS